MNKLFTKIAAAGLSLAMAVGVGVAVGSASKSAAKVNAASEELAFHFSGSSLATGTTYQSWSGSVSSSTTSKVSTATWQITVGNNSAQLGTNAKSGNLSKTTLGNGSFSAASGVASALGITTTTQKYAAVYCTTGMSYITKGELIFTGTNGGNITQAWLLSSTNGTSWTIESTKSSSITSGSTFSVTKSATAKQFAFVCYWNLTNAGGLKGFQYKLYGEYPETGTITASATEAYSDESVTLTTNATSATWSITSGGSYAHLSSTSGKSVSLVGDAAGSVTVKAVASGYTDATKTITFTERPAGTYYDVTFDSNGGSSSPAVESIQENATFTFPSPGTKTHYSFLGWSSDGGTTKYATGATSPAVVADITYTAYWEENAKVTVTYAAGTNATGSYSHTNQYVGSYTLLALSSLSGITYDSTTYRLKDYVVGGVSKQPGDSITLSAATTVTVNFEEIPLEYEVVFGTTEGTSGITDFSNTSYIIPSGVTLDNIQGNVYSNTSNQAASLRFGKSGTTGSFDASITGNYYIVSVKCNLKYYGSDSTATFAVTPSGGTAISKSLTSDWADYTYDVSADQVKKVTLGTDVNGKRAYLSGFTITYAAKKTLSNIALSGTYPTTFTKGDTFSHTGMVVTANYSDSTSAVVTGSATWSSPDMSTTGAKTITVSYSDEYGSVSTTYSITVNYAAVSSLTLGENTAEIGLGEVFDYNLVSVTVSPSNANPAHTWSVLSNTVNDDYVFDASGLLAGDTEGTITLKCASDADASKYATLVVTVTGDPTAAFVKESTTGYAGKSEVISFTYGNMDDVSKITVASSNTSYVTVANDLVADEGEGLVTINFVAAGSANVTISYDGGATLDTLPVTVSADSVVSVSWNASDFNVYSGTTLTSDIDNTWLASYEMASGDDGLIEYGDYTLKLGGSAITLPHTWSVADSGKTLCIEYGGVSSSTVSVTVTQSLRPVMADVPGEESTKTWTATAAANLGSTIASVDGTDTGSVTFDDDSTMSYERTLEYVASGKSDYLAFTNSYIQFGSSNALEKLVLTAATTGTVTSVVVDCWSKNGGSNISVTVGGNAFDTSKACPSAGAEVTFSGSATGTVVITMEKSTKTAGLAQYIKSVSITTVESSGQQINIANVVGHEAAQRAVVKFAIAFNNALADTDHCTDSTKLAAAWSTASSAWTTFLSEAAALGSTEEEYAKNLVKYATAEWTTAEGTNSNEYCLGKAVSTYEYCVKNYSSTCNAFMSSVRPVASSVNANPLSVLTDSNNLTAIIVIVSLVSLTAIGGYFAIRKRKEQ